VGVFKEEGDGSAARRRHTLSKLLIGLIILKHISFIVHVEGGVASRGGGLSFLVPLVSFSLVDGDTFLFEDGVRVRFTGIVFRPPILW
jgi:hypothetical protein